MLCDATILHAREKKVNRKVGDGTLPFGIRPVELLSFHSTNRRIGQKRPFFEAFWLFGKKEGEQTRTRIQLSLIEFLLLLVLRLGNERPKDDHDLACRAQQIDGGGVEAEIEERDVNGREKRPHQKRDDVVIMPWIEPDRVEHELDDERDRQGVDEIEELEGHSAQDQRCDHERKHRNDPADALRDIRDGLAIVGLFRRLALGRLWLCVLGLDKVIQRNAEQLGDLDQDRDVGGGLCPLPLGDGLVRIIQFFCQLQLRHAVCLTKLGYVLGNDAFDIFHSGFSRYK